MNGPLPWTGCLAASCVVWAASTVGCDRPTNDRYIPKAEAARRSLAIALDAWKAGKTETQFAGQKPVVQFADSLRRAEQPLADYDIIAELPIDGGRRFEVELRFSEVAGVNGQPTAETAQYVVLGIDPIWVIRREDFDMVTHWDHPMPVAETPVEPSQPAAVSKDNRNE